MYGRDKDASLIGGASNISTQIKQYIGVHYYRRYRYIW